DVLERFCLLIKEASADTVIRATADNPFLFYEAAQELVEEYKKRITEGPCDYITWTGLPHGCGVEMFNAHSLLKARDLDVLTPYDHEHVGPALYKHPEHFVSLMLDAPERYRNKELRTTIDTRADYRRALALVKKVSDGIALDRAYTTEEILKGESDPSVKNPILFVPCVKKGKGTGHIHRCIELAIKTGGDLYIPSDSDLEELPSLLQEAFSKGLRDWQILNYIPDDNSYSLVVTDSFILEEDDAKKLWNVAPLLSIDEGAEELVTRYCDYLLDIIPAYNIERVANKIAAEYIQLPANRKSEKASKIKQVLVSVGGEDPAGLTLPAALLFESCGCSVTAILSHPEKIFDDVAGKNIKLLSPIPNLREQLADFDLVVTHYGLTAFEAVAAGCAVILLGTTSLHERLAEKYGFACIHSNDMNKYRVEALLSDIKSLYPSNCIKTDSKDNDAALFLTKLSQGHQHVCPVCQKKHDVPDFVVSRTDKRTFRRCAKCGMIYLSWTVAPEAMSYNKSYFFEDYKAQYGKTYLEDFASIKAQGVRRLSNIDFIYRKNHSSVTPSILDIGCAMGPFLDAASDSGWQVFGTDVSSQAVDYVQKTLHFPAVCANFPDFNPAEAFGVQSFDVVTMWYVIEHFQNLGDVLKAVSKIVKKGGMFAFSTPSASGVSGVYNTQSFFEQSPEDHFTLWEPARAQQILSRFGFKVVKIVTTGHHPERFPFSKLHNIKPRSFGFKLLSLFSKMNNLGDTFEVYCKKIEDIQD
ncbi:MAG: methyltransferase domain-containing protein, partial [Treponema sp.]|nr:methyltransferase domain-containing protein [Treponema sp.]